MRFSGREQRLLPFAFDGNAAERLQKAMGESKPEERALAAERPQIDVFLSDVQRRIEERGKRLGELPGDFKDSFHRHIADYLVTSVPRFDRNRNRVIETSSDTAANEFQSYKEEMVKGVDAILEQFLSVEDKAKMDAERRKREAEVKQRDLEGQLKAVGEALDRKQPEKLEETQAFSLRTPQDIETHMQEYDDRAKAVHAYGNQLQAMHREVMVLPEKWQEYVKPTAADAAILGSAAAAGAAIGVWFFGVGALVGAGLGALTAISVNAARAAALRAEQQRKAVEVNGKIQAVRDQFSAAQKKLTDLHASMEHDGKTLEDAPQMIRQKDQVVIDSRRKEISDRRARVTEGAEEGQRAQKQGMDRETQITEQREKLTQAEMQLRQRLSQTERAQRDFQQRSRAAEGRGAGVPEAQEKLKSERERIAKQQQNVQQGHLLLNEEKIRLAARTQNVQEFINGLSGEGTNLADVDRTLEEYGRQRNEELDRRTEQVAEGVTNALLGNHVTIGTVKEQRDEIEKIPPVEPQSFGAIVWSHTFESVGKAWGSIWSGFGEGIQGIFGKNSVTNFVAGLSEAVGAFGEGMMHMAAHPVEAIKGIVAMVNFFDWENFKKTYVGLWDFLTAKDEFELALKGEEGASEEKAWGKRIGNFALFLIPGYGAVGNGARAAGSAFRLARQGGAGVMRASVKAAARFTATAVPGFAERIVMMPLDMVTGLARLPFGLVRAGRGFLRPKVTAMQAGEILADARRGGVTGPKLQALERQFEGLSALEDLRGARSGLKEAESAMREGARLTPQEQELIGMAQRERTLRAAEQRVAEAQADVYYARNKPQAPEDVSAYCARAVEQRLFPNERAVRVDLAERILGRTLSPAEAEALWSAHEIPGFGKGNITRGQIRGKVSELRDFFTKEERRLLMDRGITGRKNAQLHMSALPDDALASATRPTRTRLTTSVERQAMHPSISPRAAASAVPEHRVNFTHADGSAFTGTIESMTSNELAYALDHTRASMEIGIQRAAARQLRSLLRQQYASWTPAQLKSYYEGLRQPGLWGGRMMPVSERIAIQEVVRAYRLHPKQAPAMGKLVDVIPSKSLPVNLAPRKGAALRRSPLQASKTSPREVPLRPGEMDAAVVLEDRYQMYADFAKTNGTVGMLKHLGNAVWRSTVEWVLPRKLQFASNHVKGLAAESMIARLSTGLLQDEIGAALWRRRGLECNKNVLSEPRYYKGRRCHVLGTMNDGNALVAEWIGAETRWGNVRRVRAEQLEMHSALYNRVRDALVPIDRQLRGYREVRLGDVGDVTAALRENGVVFGRNGTQVTVVRRGERVACTLEAQGERYLLQPVLEGKEKFLVRPEEMHLYARPVRDGNAAGWKHILEVREGGWKAGLLESAGDWIGEQAYGLRRVEPDAMASSFQSLVARFPQGKEVVINGRTMYYHGVRGGQHFFTKNPCAFFSPTNMQPAGRVVRLHSRELKARSSAFGGNGIEAAERLVFQTKPGVQNRVPLEFSAPEAMPIPVPSAGSALPRTGPFAPNALDEVWLAGHYDARLTRGWYNPMRWLAQIAEPLVKAQRQNILMRRSGYGAFSSRMSSVNTFVREIPVVGWGYTLGLETPIYLSYRIVSSPFRALYNRFSSFARLQRMDGRLQTLGEQITKGVADGNDAAAVQVFRDLITERNQLLRQRQQLVDNDVLARGQQTVVAPTAGPTAGPANALHPPAGQVIDAAWLRTLPANQVIEASINAQPVVQLRIARVGGGGKKVYVQQQTTGGWGPEKRINISDLSAI